MIALVAEHVGEIYKLPVATDLAEVMREDDPPGAARVRRSDCSVSRKAHARRSLTRLVPAGGSGSGQLVALLVQRSRPGRSTSSTC
jgi:hypothetical protein